MKPLPPSVRNFAPRVSVLSSTRKPTRRSSDLAVVGLGYVGLPLSLQFARCDVPVLGLDIDAAKVKSLNQGRSYIQHVPSNAIRRMQKARMFSADTDFSRVREVQAVIICVPTPLNKNREPDLSFVLNTGRAIAPFLSVECGVRGAEFATARPLTGFQSRMNEEPGALQLTPTRNHKPAFNGRAARRNAFRSERLTLPSALKKLVVLESTTYPGTTEENLRAVLEAGSGLRAGVDFHLAFS